MTSAARGSVASLALHGGDEPLGVEDGVVADRKSPSLDRHRVRGEAPRVPFAGVDGDGQRAFEAPRLWHSDARPGRAHRAFAPPEDQLPPLALRPYEQRPAPLPAREHEVDRGSAAPAVDHGDLLEDLCVLRPAVHLMAVEVARGGPRVARREDDVAASGR